MDRLTGNPFNPKPKSATVADSGKQWSERVSPNINVDEAPKVPELAATQNAGM